MFDKPISIETSEMEKLPEGSPEVEQGDGVQCCAPCEAGEPCAKSPGLTAPEQIGTLWQVLKQVEELAGDGYARRFKTALLSVEIRGGELDRILRQHTEEPTGENKKAVFDATRRLVEALKALSIYSANLTNGLVQALYPGGWVMDRETVVVNQPVEEGPNNGQLDVNSSG
jgi:hypothetical protein